MTDKQSEDMKRRRYEVRIRDIRKRWNLPKLTREQTVIFIERLMKIPGTVDDMDLHVVARLFCREMKCKANGPVYE